MKPSAQQIAAANIPDARARKEKLRAEFPFAVAKVDELKNDKSHPEWPGFKPRLIWMEQEGKRWQR